MTPPTTTAAAQVDAAFATTDPTLLRRTTGYSEFPAVLAEGIHTERWCRLVTAVSPPIAVVGDRDLVADETHEVMQFGTDDLPMLRAIVAHLEGRPA